MSLNPSSINMSQLAHQMAHPNGLRISPQNIQPPSHLPPVGIPTSTASMAMMSQPVVAVTPTMSPSGSLQSIRSSSPLSEKKIVAEINVDSPDDQDANSVTMSPTSGPTDIRTNSIAALRIKAKEHLENINKNLTMV